MLKKINSILRKIFKKSSIKENAQYIIDNPKNLILHENTQIKEGVVFQCRNNIIEIGSNTGISYYSVIFGNVKIGNYCRIGPGVKIIAGNHTTEYVEDIPMKLLKDPKAKGINIGNDVWIGTNSVILDGVTIGDSVIIGAGSIVTKSIESRTIVVGNPAKVIRKR